MLKNRIMIGAAVGAAVIVPMAGVSALASSPAGAAKPKGITCTKGTGKVNASTSSAKISLSACTGNTGTKGTTTGTLGDTSGTINWANGKSTTFSEVTGPGTKCPTTDLADELITGNVTADNTKSTEVGAAVKGEFCVTENMTTMKIKLALAKGTTFTIAK